MDKELADLLNELQLDAEEAKLLLTLNSLGNKLRGRTKSKFNRINPFYEDVFSWKERGRFHTGKDKGVTIYNSTTVNGHVTIGDHTWIGPFCSLDGGEVGLEIGSYCSVSTACHLLTHDTVRWALSKGKLKYEYAPTKIGDGCFIGVRSVITKGVTLGDRCLVCAGSVVTKSFPAQTIIAGVPARKIGIVVMEEEQVKLVFDTSNKSEE